MTVLERVQVVERETFWSPEHFSIVKHDAVEIRLSIYAHGAVSSSPAAHYVVVTGFFRLLRDLSVIDFTHQVTEEGLVFYLRVWESRSVVKSYLQNTKRYHALGNAWDFVLVDGARVSTVIGEVHRPPLTYEELQNLAYAHTQMGSRPLRFSRYFLYAGLLPFGRQRGYGSALMHQRDSKGETGFREVLEALDLLQRTLTTIDFSGISSRDALIVYARPVLQELESFGNGKTHLEGLFLAILYLATLYEQKTSFEDYTWRMQVLSHGLEKSVASLSISKGILTLLRTGFAPLISILQERGDLLHDLDDLSLFLFAAFEDTTTLEDMPRIQLRQVQQLALLALKGKGVSREQLDHFFLSNRLVTNDVQDEMILLQLLSFLEEEA